MRIADVEALHLRLPEVRETADATQDVLLVRVTTEDGRVGWGEVSSCSHVARAIVEAPRSAARRHGLREIVRGEDALDPRLWARMVEQTSRYGRCGITMSTIGAVDLALWDLRAQARGVPLHELLGSTRRHSVRAYASCLFGATPPETAERAREAVALGFTAVKFGWGPFGGDAATDAAHVRAAREAVGPEIELMVDVGGAWDARTALKRATLLAEYGIAWLEEPVGRDDVEGYRLLAERSPVPIAGGELETTVAGLRRLAEQGRVAILQPDLTICGGLTAAEEVAAAVARSGGRIVPHAFSTGVCLLASIHWVAAHPDGDLVEYSLSPSPLMRELVTSVPPLVDGRLRVPDVAGAGIELDDDVIERFRVP